MSAAQGILLTVSVAEFHYFAVVMFKPERF